jgi:hypothetical protein
MNFQGYDPADLLLSPRLTVTGGDPGSSLEGVNTSKLADGSLCVVQGTPNTVYQLQKALTAGGIAPKAGPGRWFPLTGGGGGVIQVGYAQIEKSRTLPATAVPFDTEIPSDPSGTVPLRVVLPIVTPGNFLEVDVSLNVQNPDAPNANHEFSFGVAVSFVAAPVFPTDFLMIVNSVAGGSMAPGFQTYRSLSSVEIPVGATKATIAVPYNNANLALITIYGTDGFPSVPGSWLKASEIAGASVTQQGTGTLAPFP